MIIKREPFHLLDKIVLGRVVFRPPFKVNSPMFNEARFVYIVNGKSKLYDPKNEYLLRTGDCLFMKSDNFVNIWIENENGMPSEAIVVHFYPEVLNHVYSNNIPAFFSHKNPLPISPIEKLETNILIEQYIHNLRFYFENPSYISEELLKVKIQELVLILVNTDTSGRVKSILGDLFRSPEHEFKEIIYSNLYRDLSIEDLAFFSHLSLSSFRRKFKRVFGTSPAIFIKNKRLEKAQKLLKSSQERISDIAYECGFNDITYFSKSFQAAFQCSPSQYRKKHLV